MSPGRLDPAGDAAVDHLAADLHDQPAQQILVELDLHRHRAAVEPRQGVGEALLLLGGLSIAVGDEIIDGSIASRLAAAQTRLPD